MGMLHGCDVAGLPGSGEDECATALGSLAHFEHCPLSAGQWNIAARCVGLAIRYMEKTVRAFW